MYYEDTLKKILIKVFQKHDIIDKQDELLSLNIKKLSLSQRAELKMICEIKMQENVSENLQYRVLKDAKSETRYDH